MPVGESQKLRDPHTSMPKVIGSLPHDEPGVLFADLDLPAAAKARAAIPALANARPFAEPRPIVAEKAPA